jgi:hypothetical protein
MMTKGQPQKAVKEARLSEPFELPMELEFTVGEGLF